MVWTAFSLPTNSVWLSALVLLVDMGIRIAVLGIIPGNRRPTTAMAWLLCIFFLPYVGLILFLMFGNFRLSRRRRENQAAVNKRILEGTKEVASLVPDYEGPAWVKSAMELNQNLGYFPALGGNTVQLIEGYQESLDAMAEEISRAKNFVNAEFYIMSSDDSTDKLFRELEAAAERGVRVRVLFDHIGSLRVPGYRDMIRRLKASKIQWRRMLPLLPVKGQWRRPDLRNHRKILVVDGRVGFTGSQNLIEPSYRQKKNRKIGREWVELMSRLEGPIVGTLNVMFATDWSSETEESLASQLATDHWDSFAGGSLCQVVPSGPGFVTENNLRLFNTLLYSAEECITISSPYFVPDDSLLYAITTAAQRGIVVELFVSEAGDQFLVHHAQRSYYEALLKAGVRIFLYPKPFVLHAKHFTVDSDVAIIGSSNMDMRSFSLNLEVTVMMIDREVVQQMHTVEDHYRAISRELKLEEWLERPVLARYVDNVARLTATLQ
ncbi:cardiolipin synthase [Arthrobacter psychrolactophilus]|uniref:Cardiolipin synthase n=1 Tax=Arthrobacter psychrolactophilus TaxID=92442 RepID=A0A2V5IUV6_9MICC|nr:cardiolipin synthase [Arthrobacter psychrolactophilus]PYI39152.1 cardiolipin synthase [Arthrobacter psychrolactophilus]